MSDEADRVMHELELTQWAADVRAVMGTTAGRRLLMGYATRAGCFGATFDVDPIVSAYRQGRREQLLEILADLRQHAPADYARMVRDELAPREPIGG